MRPPGAPRTSCRSGAPRGEALVEGLKKAGAQLAQLILVKWYGPRVKYLIKCISWDLAGEDAKEVASDVFRRVIRGVPGSIRRGERPSVPGCTGFLRTRRATTSGNRRCCRHDSGRSSRAT